MGRAAQRSRACCTPKNMIALISLRVLAGIYFPQCYLFLYFFVKIVLWAALPAIRVYTEKLHVRTFSFNNLINSAVYVSPWHPLIMSVLNMKSKRLEDMTLIETTCFTCHCHQAKVRCLGDCIVCDCFICLCRCRVRRGCVTSARLRVHVG